MQATKAMPVPVQVTVPREIKPTGINLYLISKEQSYEMRRFMKRC